MNKKEWLDYLYYDLGKQHYDYELCGLQLNEDGSVTSTKWKKYSEVVFPIDIDEQWKLNHINNRTIFPFEIVLDIEEKEKLPQVMKKLEEENLKNFKLFETGSRGYHIHVFFNENLNEDDKRRYVSYFGADITKAGKRVMIALEYCPHWKTGKIKEEIKWKK